MRAEPQTTRGRGHPGRVTWAVGVRGSIGSRAPRRRLVDAPLQLGGRRLRWVGEEMGVVDRAPAPGGRADRRRSACGRAAHLEAALAGHPARSRRGGGLRVPITHPVVAAAHRAHPRTGVRHRRRDRLRHRSARGMGVAGLCRPGSATPRSSGVAGLRRRRGRRARRRDGVRPLLAGQDPGAHGCPAQRPGVVGGHAPGRSRGVDRVGGAVAWAAAGLPVVGPIARAVDWATRRAGGRLGGGGGGNGPAGERGAAGRSGLRGR